jgi:8-oxo-dGTP diphosphatase
MNKPKLIKVVCALIEYPQGVLVVQRSETMKLPLKWEFPGGKLEPGEDEVSCIKREIHEELGLEIEVGQRLTPNIHNYPSFSIKLIPYLAVPIGGELVLTEHCDFLISGKDHLNEFDWAEADIPIANEYIKL